MINRPYTWTIYNALRENGEQVVTTEELLNLRLSPEEDPRGLRLHALLVALLDSPEEDPRGLRLHALLAALLDSQRRAMAEVILADAHIHHE